MNRIEKLDLVIDHVNSRLKIFDFDRTNLALLDGELVNLAQKEGLDKIIIFKCPHYTLELLKRGYEKEGEIDGYFSGKTAHMFCKYLKAKRRENPALPEENRIIEDLEKLAKKEVVNPYREDLTIRIATINDIPQIVNIFKEVFTTYPTPMDDPDYVEKVMKDNVVFAVAESEHGIESVASADVDLKWNNAEITDCATLPSQRGKGLMKNIIAFLEEEMKKRGIDNLFSLARAVSYGMNKTLYSLGYQYRGRLINNVHIAGQWESMNIWVKQVKN